MEFENVVKLIHTISQSGISHFTYEEGGVKVEIDNTNKSIAAAAGEEIRSDNVIPATGRIMKSPLVGTYYQSASPTEPPFVKPGDSITKGQVIGIVEAMKLMNEIESEFDGTLREILVSDGDVIEFGQPMFVID
jgi:acetyl-CoA carboxylase biotin carboxyl carrier protein